MNEISPAASSIKTFRFKFSNNFLPFIEEFARLHRYDNSKLFRENWDAWIKEHSEVINREKYILESSGYEGNVLVKMYKSARYYFKNKSTEKTKPKKRRQYIGLDRDLLDAIDTHIDNHALKNRLKPANALVNFLEIAEIKPIIKREIVRLKSYNLDI